MAEQDNPRPIVPTQNSSQRLCWEAKTRFPMLLSSSSSTSNIDVPPVALICSNFFLSAFDQALRMNILFEETNLILCPLQRYITCNAL